MFTKDLVLRRLPPLSALRAFEATARLGSVTRAAAELGRTHGAVSRQIHSLQESAGLPLFEKAGTGLRLNTQGEMLHRVVSDALDGLERGWGSLLDEARGPALHVACSATFAMRWLVPRLPDFYREYPEIRLRLSMTTARELRFEGADLVVAWDRASFAAADQARAIPLGDVTFGPVCAPGYPARHVAATFQAPTRIVHDHTGRAWTGWESLSGIAFSYKNELSFPHTHLCIEAAIAGLGVAVVEQRLVTDDLLAGRLTARCGFTAFPQGWAAMPFSSRAQAPVGRAFIAWLRSTLYSGCPASSR